MILTEEMIMRLLFNMDSKDYLQCTYTYVRNSARALIIRDGKIAMIRSQKYNCYEFPGGGIEEGENPIDTVIRETMEEAGLLVIRDSVREYGLVHRIQKGVEDETECFIQDNFYYLCEVEERTVPQMLNDYEADECFTLVFVDPVAAIQANRFENHGPRDQRPLEREAKVLEMLIEEGLFRKKE